MYIHVGILLVPGVDQAKIIIIIIILRFAGQLSGKVREWHLFLSLYIN